VGGGSKTCILLNEYVIVICSTTIGEAARKSNLFHHSRGGYSKEQLFHYLGKLFEKAICSTIVEEVARKRDYFISQGVYSKEQFVPP